MIGVQRLKGDGYLQLDILDNRRQSVLTFIHKQVTEATAAYIAVAFIKMTGWRLIHDDISELIQRNGSFELVFGVDFHLSEPRAIRDAIALSKDYPERVVAYGDFKLPLTDTPSFHPKLYLFDRPGGQAAFSVGSSNLTAGGLRGNVELNLAAVVDRDSIMALGLAACFRQIKENTFEPDDEFLRGYEAVHRQVQKKGSAAARDPGLKIFRRGLAPRQRRLGSSMIGQPSTTACADA